MAPCGALEGKTKTVGVAVADRKAIDGEVAGVEDLAFGQRREFDRNRRPARAPQACEHADDDIERARPGMNGHHLGAPAQAQCREQAGDAEHVVEMAMRQQDAVEPPEACATAQQLALRALAAIDQDALARGFHQKRRMVALRRGNAGRGAEKRQGEHGRQMSSGSGSRFRSTGGLTAPNATRAAARTGPSIPHRARQAARSRRSGGRAPPSASPTSPAP